MKTEDNLEPIRIKEPRRKPLWQCSVCDLRFRDTLSRARNHVNIPLSNGLILPVGFTFGRIYHYENSSSEPEDDKIDILVVRSESFMDASFDYSYFNPHEFRYELDSHKFNHYSKEKDNKWHRHMVDHDTSGALYSGFSKKGDSSSRRCFLLTSEQFEEFKFNRRDPPHPGYLPLAFEPTQLLRNVDGIEKWITQRRGK
jgi:hypothetical protein